MRWPATTVLTLLAGCATISGPVSLGTVDVPARGETAPVGTANDDAADDPAIWIDARNTARSLIVATDKKAGLYVYGLDGKVRSQTAAGRVNNVDLRQVGDRVIVAASDRNDAANGRIALYELVPASGALKPLGVLPAGPGEAYGICLWQPPRGALNAFVVMKDGSINQIELGLGRSPSAAIVRRMKLATQSEGCVADDRTGVLYVAEEDVGIWRFGARKTASVTPVPVAKVDGQRLFADVEGLAIAASGARGGYLVASSQGDNAYVLYRLPDLGYAGRFRIVASRTIGGTSETDGIEVTTARLPGFPGGLFIAQDGDNAPAAQNFKLVPWASVKRALDVRRADTR
jgi:3-phytase